MKFMDLSNLEKIFKTEPAYRLKQAKQAVFRDLISNWQETMVLPAVLREELNQKCPLEIKGEVFASKTGDSLKAIISLRDGLKIESVLMKHADGRNTVCVSSQVGCPLGCSFCATGKLGWKRNLEPIEIAEQALFFSRHLKEKGEKVSNVVFMGMGEPFLNYENVLAAIKILNDKDGFNLGGRHLSISTVGIIEGIKKLAEEKLEINLAISLHAPNDELRSRLMPINKKYPLKKVLTAVDEYLKKTRRRVMFEYIMIKGVNDSEAQAEELAKLMKKPLYFINLISYNPARIGFDNPTGVFTPSSPAAIKRFRQVLEKRGVAVTQRHRFGEDIDAACGQLVYRRKQQ